MLKKKIYIAGSGGMLGDSFYKVFKNDYLLKCSDIDVNEKWISYLDFNEYDNYFEDVKNFEPDYLFHLGALTDLEYCEKNIDETYLSNTKSVENAVKISSQLNIPILYISTAGIFDGKKEFYDDFDLPNPICHYARSKFEAEKYVQKNKAEHLIFRAGWMMGSGPNKDKKFVNKLATQISQNKKILYIVDDKLGTPTYTNDFALNVKLVLEKEIWGLYNLVCEGSTSRLNVAHEILDYLNLNNIIKIEKVSSEFFKSKYFAPRPNSEKLVNRKLNDLNMNIMRDWKTCLHEYLNEYYSYLKK
tara:strand:+ start:5688 stop:6593 length:906 start_codon:yes stop_codon:yes gene_type:complete